jgi:hypothetical protein
VRVLITRDSVAPADDAGAPHQHEVDVPTGGTLRDVVQRIVASQYLVKVRGGSTWAVRLRPGADLPATAIAVLTRDPDSVRYAGDPFARLHADAHVHLDFLRQQDAEATLALMRAEPGRADLRLG